MAFLTIFGFGFLVYRGRGNGMRVTSLSVYSFTLVFLFTMSGVFHLLEDPSTARHVLQRLDHAAIWTMIAGTFTPLHIILFRGAWRWVPLMVIWTIAIIGLVLQMIFFTSFPEFLITGLFLGLGWFGVISMIKMRNLYRDSTMIFIVIGGVLYSIGAIVDFAHWPILWPGVIAQHELFHLFVIAAASSHWYFIYKWSNHPVENDLSFSVHVFPGPSYYAKSDGDNIVVEAKDLEVLKIEIRKAVRARLHHTIEPRLRLRFFNEEYL